MKSPLPLEIVGGGLAGLSLGLALRRAGVPVTVHEAGAYPRHRVCGEFITGLSATTIARLGLEPFLGDALRHWEVAWFIDGQLASRQHLPTPALALSRHQLDARLVDALLSAGGEVHAQSRLTDSPPQPGRIFTTGRRRAQPGWIGLKIHAQDFPLQCDLEVHLGTEAYVGVTRISAHQVNLCGLFRQRPLSGPGEQLLSAYLHAAGLSALADRLAGAVAEPGSFCAVAGLSLAQTIPPTDRVALGDAWAMIPPYTGNGMAMAFQSAECALDPLLAYAQQTCDWPATCRAIHRAVNRRFRVRLAAADWLHPFLLEPARQRWLTRLSRAHLLPLRPLYAVLH